MKKHFLSCVAAIFMVCFAHITACSAIGRGASSPSDAVQAASFTDVPSDVWYADAIVYCKQQGIMNGITADTFAPEEPVTRAMMAAILYRMDGSPAVSKQPGFIDIIPGAWYCDAVAWAAENHIISGYNSAVFGVDDLATREQAAVVLWRDAGSPQQEAADGISDIHTASSWAQQAIHWANANGILNGMIENHVFSPKAAVKRGEIAAMLYAYQSHSYDNIYPQHEPYGTGIGAMPGRVVWDYAPDSVDWDGNGYWWRLEHFDEIVIQRMVNDSITVLGGAETVQDGWMALFQAHNAGRGKSGGYMAGEKIAIKTNINGSAVMDDDTSGETQMSYTNPVLLKTLLVSLVKEAGVAPSDITVYDVSRLFPDYMVALCTQGELSGVNFVGRNQGVADEQSPIIWSHKFSGRVNYLPTCVTEAEYMINLANLKGHSYGITLCGKNHFGSFINGNVMRPPEGANLHQWLTQNEMGIYSPLVDLMANADLGGKTVLYMLDALICATSEGASMTGDNTRWQQHPFDGNYTSSILVSQDPVAIDSVGADLLMNEPTVTSHNGALRDNPTVENYLHEAGLVANSPSGTVYTDSHGNPIMNLGVHEHWNNAAQKQYSRNLGKNEGIELIQLY